MNYQIKGVKLRQDGVLSIRVSFADGQIEYVFTAMRNSSGNVSIDKSRALWLHDSLWFDLITKIKKDYFSREDAEVVNGSGETE